MKEGLSFQPHKTREPSGPGNRSRIDVFGAAVRRTGCSCGSRPENRLFTALEDRRSIGALAEKLTAHIQVYIGISPPFKEVRANCLSFDGL
jgi:hypothetical protein